MKDEEILRRVITKAIENGFHWEGDTLEGLERWIEADWRIVVNARSYYVDIFSHDFAKAFWGKGKYYANDNMPVWKVHIQRMVLEKTPLQYLKKFL